METLERASEVRQRVRQWKQAGERVALVPTMGNLHEAHLALVDEARAQADRVVVSIFVNPAQFGPGEDFETYPRTPEEDSQALRERGADLLFMPSVEEMYPRRNLAWVEVEALDRHLCGASRPGHFRGVCTVVTKLFHMVEPDLAWFGEKDYQQLAILRRMTEDLCFPVEIRGVATVREPDGLAMSSRNRYLSKSERSLAPQLYRHLCQAREAILEGDRNYEKIARNAMKSLEKSGFAPDYFEIANAGTLAPATPEDHELVIAAAARLGTTRLIDNVAVTIVRSP